MEPVVVMLHPDLGEHLLDEVFVGLGTTLARDFEVDSSAERLLSWRAGWGCFPGGLWLFRRG